MLTRTPPDLAPRSLLKDRAYAEVKELIQTVVFPPGAFLSERQLAAQLGMSKTPIKAALERLEAEGFISVAPQQGIVVRDVTVQEIADQFEIREALESYVLRQLAGRLTPEAAERIEQNLAGQLQAVASDDQQRLIVLDADFHLLFCELLGNHEIQRVLSQLRDKIHRVIAHVFRQNPARLQPCYEEHRAIADALLAGDPDASARRLVEHLNYGRQFLLQPRRSLQ